VVSPISVIAPNSAPNVGAAQQCDRGADQHDRDQPAAVQRIPERDDQHDADGVAELGGGHQRRRRPGGDLQVVRDQVQQRLGPVQVADCDAAHDGQ
jgi:hypothetical protein